MRAVDSYVICTSPRSGSTMLCSLLAATGVAGKPESWFHRPSLEDWADALDVTDKSDGSSPDLLTLFAAAQAKGSSNNGVFGLRLQRDSFDFLFAMLRQLHPDASADVERFERVFGHTRFIHLAREDKLAQAISCVRAQQSGLWHVAADGSELQRSAPHREPQYDANAIKRELDEFVQADRLWNEWFDDEQIEPHRVLYSGLSADPSGVTRRIVAALDLDPNEADRVTPGVRKLADNLNAEWARRFRSEGHLRS